VLLVPDIRGVDPGFHVVVLDGAFERTDQMFQQDCARHEGAAPISIDVPTASPAVSTLMKPFALIVALALTQAGCGGQTTSSTGTQTGAGGASDGGGAAGSGGDSGSAGAAGAAGMGTAGAAGTAAAGASGATACTGTPYSHCYRDCTLDDECAAMQLPPYGYGCGGLPGCPALAGNKMKYCCPQLPIGAAEFLVPHQLDQVYLVDRF
jgi:hypothetical protein